MSLTPVNDNREGMVFEYDGKEYVLTFSLAVLQKMENKGSFNIQDLQQKLLNAPKKLFSTAFEVYHPLVPLNKRYEIFESMARYETVEDGDEADTLMGVLGEMLTEAIESINPSGNVKWRRRTATK